MSPRIRVYQRLLRWSSLPLLIATWLMLITGPGVFKSEILRKTTLGLVNPATAGKWHSVWLPPATALIFYVHTTMGLQVMLGRARWIKPKWIGEIAGWAIGLLGLTQFLWLFYG